MSARWRYVVPNLFTCVSITAGMLSIAEAVAGRFESSAWFILLSVLLDKADGTAARLLKASSRFGMELDSLADFLTFGVAPPVMVAAVLTRGGAPAPTWLPHHYHYLAYIGSGLWTICAALRLAKFNVKTELGDTHFFGAPTTVSGAFIGAYYLTACKYELAAGFLHAMPGIMIFFALLMVSNIPLRKVAMRKSLAYNVLLLANVAGVYVCGLLRIFPEYLFIAGNLYLWIGMIWATVAGVKPPAADDVGTAAGPLNGSG
jgi:CDP-diacylglycerol--serine O-phosphatidyltransferase